MVSYASASYPIMRDGAKLIVPVAMQNQEMPPPCVKCGAPANGKRVKKTFAWHHPAIYLTILGGFLLYLIVAAIVRKRIRLTVPLCARHTRRRSLAVNLSWVIPLVGVADAFILPNLGVEGWVVAWITATFVLTGLIMWSIVDYPIRPRYIDNYRAVFSGVCSEYLQQFPPGRA